MYFIRISSSCHNPFLTVASLHPIYKWSKENGSYELLSEEVLNHERGTVNTIHTPKGQMACLFSYFYHLCMYMYICIYTYTSLFSIVSLSVFYGSYWRGAFLSLHIQSFIFHYIFSSIYTFSFVPTPTPFGRCCRWLDGTDFVILILQELIGVLLCYSFCFVDFILQF